MRARVIAVWRVARSVVIAAAALALGACAVARPNDLETRLWSCDAREDCLDGWSCADANVLGTDFCRPACDPTDPASCLDGICTQTGECLSSCVIWGDVTSRCPDGQTCVRTDLLGDEGVCTVAPGCSVSSECGEGTQCLNDAFQLPASISGVEYASDHLYCVAIPDATARCPSGYLKVDVGGGLCLPRCDSEGARCPPGLVCLRELGFLFGQPGTSPCWPGYWGVPCDDDAQCMIGRCLDVGEGRRACTYDCEQADRVFRTAPGGGCAALGESARDLRLDALLGVCEAVGAARHCVPRGTAGAPCNDDTLCAPGLECRTFGQDGEQYRFCSRGCTQTSDCTTAGAPLTAFCQLGSCVPRSFTDGPCALPEHCREGHRCESGTCMRVAPPE